MPAIALAAPPATRREPRPTSDSAARRRLVWGDRDPATIPWRSGPPLARQALDEHSDAEQLVEDELTLARVFVADRAVGTALRARGLLMRGDAAIAGLREAVQVVADSPARLEYARAAGDESPDRSGAVHHDQDSRDAPRGVYLKLIAPATELPAALVARLLNPRTRYGFARQTSPKIGVCTPSRFGVDDASIAPERRSVKHAWRSLPRPWTRRVPFAATAPVRKI
jgi:hypothetical protein